MNQSAGKQHVYKTTGIWLLILIALALLIDNHHRTTGTFNWMTPLWADQAGYYVYLPSLFIYDFDASKFPEGIVENTGNGFELDLEANKVITRYSNGVAIMQTPFFLLVHFVAGITNQPRDGFSGIYHKVPNISALFYAVIGLYFLLLFLRHYFNLKTAAITLLLLFWGTNFYYYAVDNTGMSHIYSFALFSAIAFVTQKMLLVKKEEQWAYFSVWSILFAMIVLVRPTNILLFPFLFTLHTHSISDIRTRIIRFSTSRNIIILFVSFLVVFSPQLLYWRYISGSFIYYSYEGYGFTNFLSPKILQLWFSPDNGMFLYNPLYLIVVVAMVKRAIGRNNTLNDKIILFTFLILTYLFASWFTFSFGCGFGSRNFVEYNVMFAIPLSHLIKWLSQKKHLIRLSLAVVLVGMVGYNLILIHSYNRCFEGSEWDFREFASYLMIPKEYQQELELNEEESKINHEKEFSIALKIPPETFSGKRLKKARVEFEAEHIKPDSEALMVLTINNPDTLVYWNSHLMSDQIDRNNSSRQNITGEFQLPASIPENSELAVYLWNIKKENIALHKMNVTLKWIKDLKSGKEF